MRLNPHLRGSPSRCPLVALPTRRRYPARRLRSMEESDLHLHLSREASDPAAHQDETRFIVNQYRRMPERIWAYIWAADRRRAAVGACRNSFGCSATPAPMLATMSSGSAVRSSPGLIVEP